MVPARSPSASEPVPSIPAHPPGVRLVTLENGLVLILREDHTAPVVSAQVWCRAGSIDEGRWLGAGMSHVLEHMLFKGTATRGAGRIDQEIQDAGGYMNAYTSFDRTVYWINVPNDGAGIAVDILCDIVQNASLPVEEMEKEKQVILREMDMNQDDPARRSGRRLFETAYTVSPYRYTIIGYPDVYNRLTREDIFNYYHEKYVPNNLFLVVVGAINSREIEAQVRAAFAASKTKPLPPTVLPEEPKQTAPREVIEEAPIELGHFHYAWHVPDVRHPDVPALDVLAVLLGGGRSSRLYQEVREKLGLVSSVDAWIYSPGRPGIFGMSAVVEPAKFIPAREAMLEQIERLKRGAIPPEELAKAVKQFISATLSTRKTMQGQAQDLGGNWMAAYDLNFSERYLAAVKSITTADLQRVARTYLTAENRTLFALLPKGTQVAAGELSETAADHPIQKFELENGLRLLVKEDHRLPFVEFRSVFTGGVLTETPATNGITLLTAKMLLQGTAARSAEQIATEIESLGGSLDSYGGNNSFGVNAEVLTGDFDAGLALVSDVILNPALPGAALEREKEIQLAAIRAQRDQVLQSASRALRRGLFGQTGYGLDVNGTEESVAKISVADCAAFHQKMVIPNNCVLAIYGDVNPAQVKAAVEKVFAGWRKGELLPFTPPPASPLRRPRIEELREKKQAALMVGFPSTTLFDPDRYPLELLQESCSDLGSRLFLRIRERLGLAYYVGAQNVLGLAPGYFAFYAGTAPEKAALVEEELLQEAALLRSEGLTAEELARAKAKVIGQKKIARQELGGYAMTTALDELYGLGYANSDTEDAKYQAVLLEDIQRVAQKYLVASLAVVAIVKPVS